jgi:hypothetical protein
MAIAGNWFFVVFNSRIVQAFRSAVDDLYTRT